VVESGDLEKFDKNLAKNTNIFFTKENTRKKQEKQHGEYFRHQGQGLTGYMLEIRHVSFAR